MNKVPQSSNKKVEQKNIKHKSFESLRKKEQYLRAKGKYQQAIAMYENAMVDSPKNLDFLEAIIDLMKSQKKNEIVELIDNKTDIIIKYQYSEKFDGSEPMSLISKLLELGKAEQVIKYLHKFIGVSHQELAKKLIAIGEEELLASNLKKFKGLDAEIAIQLIKSEEEGQRGCASYVADNISRFKNIHYRNIAQLLTATEDGSESLIYNIDKFVSVGRTEILLMILNSTCNYHLLSSCIEEFTEISPTNIIKMYLNVEKERAIERAEWMLMNNYIPLFEKVDYSEILLIWLTLGLYEDVRRTWGRFRVWFNNTETAMRIIDLGIPETLELIKGIDVIDIKVAQKLAETGNAKYIHPSRCTENLDGSIAEKIIESGNAFFVLHFREYFNEVDCTAAALKLILSGDAYTLSFYLKKCNDLAQEVAMKLIDKGYGEDVAEYLEHFIITDKASLVLKFFETGQEIQLGKVFKKLDVNYSDVLKILTPKGKE